MKAGCIVLRVSTDEQDEERQLHSCLQLAKRMSIDVPPSRILRGRESGRGEPKPRADALALVRKGAVRHIIVDEISRWARQGARALLNDLALLEHNGASMHVVTQPMIGQPGFGQAATFFYALFAAEESARISERTRSGLAHARRELEREGCFRARKSGRVVTGFGRPRVLSEDALACAAYLREVRQLGWAAISRHLEDAGLGPAKSSTVRMALPAWVTKHGYPRKPPAGLQIELPGCTELPPCPAKKGDSEGPSAGLQIELPSVAEDGRI